MNFVNSMYRKEISGYALSDIDIVLVFEKNKILLHFYLRVL